MTDSTKPLLELTHIKKENLEVSVNPTDVLRGAIYQNSERGQSSDINVPNQSTEALRERCEFSCFFSFLSSSKLNSKHEYKYQL